METELIYQKNARPKGVACPCILLNVQIFAAHSISSVVCSHGLKPDCVRLTISGKVKKGKAIPVTGCGYE
jgi:hypothetical protein